MPNQVLLPLILLILPAQGRVSRVIINFNNWLRGRWHTAIHGLRLTLVLVALTLVASVIVRMRLVPHTLMLIVLILALLVFGLLLTLVCVLVRAHFNNLS